MTSSPETPAYLRTRLDGTVALVTGASSGIGRATAFRLVDEGATVALVARRHKRLHALVAELRSHGGTAIAVPADIATWNAAHEAVSMVTSHFGRLDTLVNAAGVMLNGQTELAEPSEWEAMVDVNLKGLMWMTKAALPHLLDATGSGTRGVADVVNISSIAGRVTAPTVAVYNATKFGVTAATDAWRQEYTRRNVRFAVIEPGAVDTELFGHMQEHARTRFDALYGDVEKLHAEDIADAIAFVVTAPRRRAINEIVIRPTDQA